MDSGISLIKSLATTLLSEIDSIAVATKDLGEDDSFVLSNSVRDFEIKLIKTALLKTGGNQRRAASILGVKVTTLHNKIKTYGIDCLKIPV
ncbi:MAG TPA: helix-turn-helix domain-containing protein [Pyrinomonadaceae bacterium]|jgi:DNA-binding NtrC family response regulator|nr:helix-turn-helix domain-containing protein [Pyrinomonadaceae bacterium]